MELHQVFGYFSGKIKIEDKTMEVKDLIGLAEEQVALW